MHDVLRSVPDAERWALLPAADGVGVYVDKGKFFVKYTQRREDGTQMQVRHGTFDSQAVAKLLARWLGAQDGVIRKTPGAARAFLVAQLAGEAAEKKWGGEN